jgi:hypothetical protein
MKFGFDDERRVERQVVHSALSSLTDSVVNTQSAVVMLAMSVAAEIGVGTMMFVAGDKVQQFLNENDDFWIYGSVGIFLIGFLAVFATLAGLIPSGSRLRPFPLITWAVSILAGLLNIGLFFAILTVRMK